VSAVTVTGVMVYSEVILQATTLTFNSGSTLLLAPSASRGGGPPTTLTIIANEIDINGPATIIYNFDGAPAPAYDPGTPKPPQMGTAANGSDGFSASGTGSFPQAANGGDGGPGMTGAKGIAGVDAPEIQIFVGLVKQMPSAMLTINVKGQDGGSGGSGGSGGKGGNGQEGSPSTTSSSWYDNSQCTQGAGKGGNGGAGGDAGFPGRGGAGGNGGIVNVFTLAPSLPIVQAWTYIVAPGKGGAPGNPGKPGNGGTGGPAGAVNSPCPPVPGFGGSNGPNGQAMSTVDPTWFTDYAGQNGQPGYSAQYQIKQVPS
jgi:hypothetical protein